LLTNSILCSPGLTDTLLCGVWPSATPSRNTVDWGIELMRRIPLSGRVPASGEGCAGAGLVDSACPLTAAVGLFGAWDGLHAPTAHDKSKSKQTKLEMWPVSTFSQRADDLDVMSDPCVEPNPCA
jgi:hypothetical protein